MAATTPQRVVQPIVGLLNLLGFLLGVAGFLLFLVWTLQALGWRSQVAVPLPNGDLELAIRDNGYAARWFSLGAVPAEWVFPASAFEPVAGLLALVTSFIILWRDKLRDRFFPRAEGAFTSVTNSPRVISLDRAKIREVNIGTVMGGDYYTSVVSARSAQEQRNRKAMLTKVRKIWVEGLLNRSLTDELRIDLNLVDRPDLLNLPLNAIVQELEQLPKALPPGKPLIEVFDEFVGELLILGAPGAGKTTLLLELLRDLLKRAEQDEAHPLPMVFPLSSWAAERKPLQDWLVDQLNVIYDVPKKTGQGWLTENEVLPLLDGLDEVAAEHRDACVEAINKYRQEVGGLAPIAVASRIEDYEALKGRLRLRGAVLVEPLTAQQVEGYLLRVGEPLRAVRELVESDPEVTELLESPLMLSVVTLAFQNTSPETLRTEGTLEERRGRLWETYTERMLARRSHWSTYSARQTVLWLVEIAQLLATQKQTVFYKEMLIVLVLSFPKGKLEFGRYTFSLINLLISLFFFFLWLTSIFAGYSSQVVNSLLAVGGASGVLLSIIVYFWPRDYVKLVNIYGKYILRKFPRTFAGGEYTDIWDWTRNLLGQAGQLDWQRFSEVKIAPKTFVLFLGRNTAYWISKRILFLNNYLPEDPIPWLDHCCDRLFLRRVGGGYIFIHRMLLEHFASKYEEPSETQKSAPTSVKRRGH